MEKADKDWMMIRMVGGSVFLLIPALVIKTARNLL